MVRIAVLGCGRIGAMHAGNIHKHEKAELAAVYDVHSPAAEAAYLSRAEHRAVKVEEIGG